MKKTFKRAGVAVLSMAMLLSMGAVGTMTASAAGESIKVEATSGLKATDQVKIYKVASKSASGWAWDDADYGTAANAAVTGFDDFVTLGAAGVTDAQKAKVAKALAGVAKGKVPTYTTTVGTAQAVDEGYYVVLVTPTDNSTMVQPILEEIKTGEAFVAASTKVEQISLSKTIDSVTNGGTNVGDVEVDGKNAMAKSGDTITYKIVAPIPSYDNDVAAANVKPFVLTDTFASTLNYVSATAIVGDTAAATTASTGAPTVTPAHTDGTQTFTATLSGADLLNCGGKFLIVTFTATLGDDPTISKGLGERADQQDTAGKSADANKNDATLTFGNDYTTGGYFDRDGDGTEDPEEIPELNDYADVYTSAIYINKTLNGTPAAANDVGFTLYKKSDYDTTNGVLIGTPTPVRAEQKTNASGVVSFKGIDAGEYVLIETTPKAGYKSAPDTLVTIRKDGNVSKFTASTGFTAATGGGFETDIDNPSLESLPGTGGIGTIIFTAGGAAIVLLAGILFVIYMRKRKEEV